MAINVALDDRLHYMPGQMVVERLIRSECPSLISAFQVLSIGCTWEAINHSRPQVWGEVVETQIHIKRSLFNPPLTSYDILSYKDLLLEEPGS